MSEPPAWEPGPWPEMTPEQLAQWKESFKAAVATSEYKILPHPPPLTPQQVRYLLRECVTVVRPGEVLVIRADSYTAAQIEEINRCANWWLADNAPGVKALVVPGDELAVITDEEPSTERTQ